MAKTLQFRCPKCKKKLFKWEQGSDKLQDDCGFNRRNVKNTMYISCPKCNCISVIDKFELKEVEVAV